MEDQYFKNDDALYDEYSGADEYTTLESKACTLALNYATSPRITPRKAGVKWVDKVERRSCGARFPDSESNWIFSPARLYSR